MPRESLKERMERAYERITRQRHERSERAKHEQRVLPPDFTGYVFTKACEEAEKIQGWIKDIDEQIPEVEAKIREAEKEVRAACTPLMQAGKVYGNILFDHQIVPPREDPHRYMLTKEALKVRKEKVAPLREYLKVLRRRRYACEHEIGELSRIAMKATTGDVGLIHFLSDKWRSRFELGAGIEGIPAKLKAHWQSSVPVDSMGYPLPKEALEDGKPDMPMSGRRVPKE